MNDGFETVAIVVLFVVGIVLGAAGGRNYATNTAKQAAITANVGEYVMNPTNGVSTFQFKTNLVEVCREGK
jgi:hypothetical protein